VALDERYDVLLNRLWGTGAAAVGPSGSARLTPDPGPAGGLQHMGRAVSSATAGTA